MLPDNRIIPNSSKNIFFILRFPFVNSIVILLVSLRKYKPFYRVGTYDGLGGKRYEK
jgi:hypothetical protein